MAKRQFMTTKFSIHSPPCAKEGGFEVTNACRGCLAHRCEDVCPKGAIPFDHMQKVHIDKTKCVECRADALAVPVA